MLVLEATAGDPAGAGARFPGFSPVKIALRNVAAGAGGVDRYLGGRAGLVVCGNPACRGSWFRFLQDRRRPIFERRWGCSLECLQAMVRKAIGRESDADAAPDEGEHRHRIPLGLILLSQGWISPTQLQRALDQQQRVGDGRIGEWLVRECGLPQEVVTRALGVQWRCPVLAVEGFDPAAMALVAPKLLLETTGMLPLRMAARTLYLAFADRVDAAAAFAVSRMGGIKVEPGLIDGIELDAARRRLDGCEFAEACFAWVADKEAMARSVAQALRMLRPRASRLVRVHQMYWLRMWLEAGAMSRRDGGVPVMSEDIVDRLYSVEKEVQHSTMNTL